MRPTRSRIFEFVRKYRREVALFMAYCAVFTAFVFSVPTLNHVFAQVNSTYSTTTPTMQFWVPETACSSSTTGTVGAGNATDILGGSGGVRVHRSAATAAAASIQTIVCNFQIPFIKWTAGQAVSVTSIDFLNSSQTTQPTSLTTPTLKTFTPPAPIDPETANSATFVAAGGTITVTPTSAQYAAYTPVAAGQFFTIRVNLATPVAVVSPLQTFQLTMIFNQSASAISIQETPGFYVNTANYLF